MNKVKQKRQQRYQRHKRIRAKVIGTKDCPRLSVFRSNQHIYVQLIDDNKGQTLASFSDFKIKRKKGLTKIAIAKQIGNSVAKKALEKKIKKVIFDRGGYKYHGQVKSVAEGARQGGLKF
jgi:large subunit ribosomal protein L18